MQSARAWILDRWEHHPRIALALRAALAASLAWSLVRFVPGAQDYPYYAPFGAIIATTFTLAGSVRESLQAVAAIIVGGTIAFTVDLFTGEAAPLTVGIVVALSVSVAGWRLLGPMGGWAPTAALFTLIIGHGEAFFIGAYGGLTLFGALVGILVNMATPPLPLAPARSAVGHTRGVLAKQLRELANFLSAHELPEIGPWKRDHTELTRARTAMQEAVSQAEESRTANARARRHRDRLELLAQEADSLDRIFFIVSDVGELLLRPTGIPGDPSSQATLSDEAREPIARAMHRVADALDAYTEGADASPELQAADAELNLLLRESRATHEQVLVHSVVLALRRALDTFA